jgi:C-terminal processing protease CtpA/Prc
LDLQQPGKPFFTEPVFMLIDSGCFSTTSEFLTVAHVHHRATFIGQESAGAYSGNNSGTVVRFSPPTPTWGCISLL